MPRDGAYINHNDFDQPQGNKDISDNLYEKTKSKMKSNKPKESLEDPMMEAIKKDEHPVKDENPDE